MKNKPERGVYLGTDKNTADQDSEYNFSSAQVPCEKKKEIRPGFMVFLSTVYFSKHQDKKK